MGQLALRGPYKEFSGVGSGGNFPDPFLDIASLSVPTNMRSALYWCLPPGALVELQDFSLKRVEEIRPGDLVRNKDGGIGEVSRNSARRHSGELVALHYGGYGNTFAHRMTPDHKVWLWSGGKFDRVPARDVKEGDVVATPLPAVTNDESPRFSGWLLGLYAAEGCFIKDGWRRLGVRFCMGRDDEENGVLNKLLAELREQADLSPTAYTPPSRPDSRLVTVCGDPELPDWCFSHAGQEATGKCLASSVLRYGQSFVLGFLAGWIDGDGWATPTGLYGCTSSRALAVQVIRLANACGLTPSIRRVANDKGFGNDDSVSWQVQFGKADVEALRGECVKAIKVDRSSTPARPRYRLGGGYALRPVLATWTEGYDGPVYNFEVKGDHSYIADGVTTSNCEYIFSMFGTYRMAMERVISYFLTDIVMEDASEDENEKWTSLLNDVFDVLSVIQNKLRDRMCFHGDTKAVTRDGVFRLRDLSGKTVDVLSQDGVYRPAAFKSFGKQELLEVEFSDGRAVLATPEHQWVVKNCSGKTVRVPTLALCGGYRIERTVADRPERDADYYEGVRHGFVFGDGTLYNHGRQAAAYFFGSKDAVLLKYFEGHGCAPYRDDDRGAIVVNGLPPHYKTLPENSRSASYWYGFVCGFLAADGTVDVYGCAVLTQQAKATLEIIAEQLSRIGMVAGPVRGHWRSASFVRRDGRVDEYEGVMHYVTLLKRFMLPQDFLLSAHRDNFEENYKPTKYGQYVGIKAVRETGIVDEVFCCVETETHTFVIENAVLTGNCYGNSFSSVVVPFKRFLTCPKCHYLAPLKEVVNNKHFKFKWIEPEFHASCPVCKVGSGYTGRWNVADKDDDEEKKIKIKIWSPHEIEIVHDLWTGDRQYIWRIPEDYKMQIHKGHLFHLERAPMEVINAVHRNQVYKFNPDALFHMHEPTLSGLQVRGWGLPRILFNFRQIWYVQVLRRFNEAIALDYVIPFRIITPAPAQGRAGTSAIDPMTMYNGGDFRGQVQSMIRRRRRDPNSLQILPFPVNFQMFGAEANQLAPRDLMDQASETLLNDSGTPVELYNGSLQLQTAPVALRLFESTWHHLVHDSNAFLAWLVRQVSQIMSWETVDAKLKRVTIADNLEKQMMAAQLMMSQQLSGTTVIRDLGYDWKQEQKQIAEEARYQSELQARTQEEMQQAGFAQQIAKGQSQQGGDPSQGGGGGAQGGGDPSGGAGAGASMGTPMQGPVSQYLATMSPNVPQTPTDMLQVADSLATELMGLPETVKDSELRKLKTSNEALHALVKARMEQMRDSTKQQAGNAAVGQQQQQAQGQQQGAGAQG
jgi:hypothetical protein